MPRDANTSLHLSPSIPLPLSRSPSLLANTDVCFVDATVHVQAVIWSGALTWILLKVIDKASTNGQ